MSGELNPHELRAVLGCDQIGSSILMRTALHGTFNEAGQLESYIPLGDAEDHHSRYLFTAVGSRAVRSEFHLPVFDANAGAELTTEHNGSVTQTLTLPTLSGEKPQPSTALHDILARHKISCESTEISHPETKQTVGAIVLRASADRSTFAVLGSSSEGHAHVYLQKQFSVNGFTVLVDGLHQADVISDEWRAHTIRDGMGIVRTPWTDKAQSGRPSLSDLL